MSINIHFMMWYASAITLVLVGNVLLFIYEIVQRFFKYSYGKKPKSSWVSLPISNAINRNPKLTSGK